MKKTVLAGTNVPMSLSMPISKVDSEKRLVSGFATLDNIDAQGDRVTPAASADAFSKFRGNIREMHQESLAAGRLVSFEEQTFFSEEDNKFYSGVYVTAYVSKGAENTWQKVLDGTLSGFSIGGNVLEYELDVDDDGNTVKTITKYLLTELSLVDNPANQLANILSIIKSADGTQVLEGIAVDVDTQTIFFCSEDKRALLSRESSHDCPVCGSSMEDIGWCESSGTDAVTEMEGAVTKYLSNSREGGAVNKMTTENKEEVTETEEVEVTEVPAEEQVDDETVDAAEPEVEGDEVHPDNDEGGEDLTEVIKEFQNRVMEAVKQGNEAQAEKVDELRKEFGGIEERFASKLSDLEKVIQRLETEQDELGKSFKGIQESVSEVEKGLRDVDPTTALKKSVDHDQSTEVKSQSLWDGSFLNIDSM